MRVSLAATPATDDAVTRNAMSTGSTVIESLSSLDDRVGEEQVDALYRQGLVGVLGALMAAVILEGMLIYLGSLTWVEGAAWTACVCCCVGFHVLLAHLYHRADQPDRGWKLWGRRWALAALFDGLWWGSMTLALVRGHVVELQFLTMMVALTVAVGAVVAFSTYLLAFRAIFYPISFGALVSNLMEGGALHHAAALLVVVFIVTIADLANRSHESFATSVRMRFEKDALTESLRRQKELAEDANIAKSRFLAAASHDLRQPVHALGLFVGALAQQPMTVEMRQLVSYIESSLESIDELFTSLLDISRLDAGVVEKSVQSFAVSAVLQRIQREYLPEASGKGIVLRTRASSAVVASDPMLLERILRNLVSNAIRYTDRGRVLVGCRHRGTHLDLQVWDTGRGIGAADRDHIFQEFYQVGNPERDREKGLGLGLAIVRRLSHLLDHPIDFQSEVGRGSVFKVSIPLSDRRAAPEIAAPLAVTHDGLRRLILVIDDEVRVQDAMKNLLVAWGNDVIAAGSYAEMLDKLAGCTTRPDLILCDYRLRHHENGVEVIEQLQAEYNYDIPAILITGDTAADRLHQVRDSGFVVLHKPVVNAKLRATIGNVLNAHAAATADT